MSVVMMNRVGMRWHINPIFILPLLVVLLVACQPPEVAPRRTTMIRIAGSSAMQPVLYDLTTAFTHQHPTIRFEITGGNSTTGEEQVMAGQVELAASNLISPTVAAAAGQGVRPSAAIRIPIGIDGLAIIVHPDNPVAKLTMTEVQALYNGRFLTWMEVGGPTLEVRLISREDGSGNRQLFDTRVMGEERVSLTAVVMPTNRDVVDYVATHPNAIGYVSRAYVNNVVEQTTQNSSGAETPTVKVVALEDQLPTQQAIQTQSYLLIQPLYLVSRVRPIGALQQFIDFALSPAGQAIVARYHGRVR